MLGVLLAVQWYSSYKAVSIHIAKGVLAEFSRKAYECQIKDAASCSSLKWLRAINGLLPRRQLARTVPKIALKGRQLQTFHSGKDSPSRTPARKFLDTRFPVSSNNHFCS